MITASPLLTAFLLLVLNSTAAIQLRNNALAHAALAAQAKPQPAPEPYAVCTCTNVEWNRSVETWSYHPDHPNLSVEFH